MTMVIYYVCMYVCMYVCVYVCIHYTHTWDPFQRLPRQEEFTDHTAVLPIQIPEFSIEGLDKSWISRWSLEVLNTMLSLFLPKLRP